MAVVKRRETKGIKPGVRVDEALMKAGKFEVTKDMNFTIDIFLKLFSGRWVLMTRSGVDIEEHNVVFRMWTYDEMIELKKMATEYDPKKRIHMTDNDLLNRLKVQRLMLSWTFDRDNPRLRIQHSNGILTDESWEAFVSLQPNITSHILEEMNRIYEFNG